MFVPPLLFGALGHAWFGGMIAVGALFTAFCDFDGPHRARILAIATILGALLLALGQALGGTLWLAALVIFVATFLGGFGIVYGRNGAVLAIILNVVLLVGLGLGGGPGLTAPSAGAYVCGGAFFLALGLLPALARRNRPLFDTSRESTATPRLHLKHWPRVALASPLAPYIWLRPLSTVAARGAGLGIGAGLPAVGRAHGDRLRKAAAGCDDRNHPSERGWDDVWRLTCGRSNPDRASACGADVDHDGPRDARWQGSLGIAAPKSALRPKAIRLGEQARPHRAEALRPSSP